LGYWRNSEAFKSCEDTLCALGKGHMSLISFDTICFS
jgi:hypothetical protein